MAGYTRVDTSNNIADGNVISAADLDNEFDGIQAAFNASTGHNHDGTTGEGAPILVLGPTQDVVVGASTVTPKTTNTVDIGSSSLKFKDLYLAGNASIGGTLGVTGATTLSAALTYGGVTLSNAVTGTGNMVLSASPTLTGTLSGANASLSGTLAVTGVATLTAQPILSSLTASRAVFTDGSKGLVSNAITGTGNVVMSTSPTLVTPVLGTPASVTLTNGTGLPVSTGISGLGTGVATALAVNVGSAGAPVVNGGALGTPSSGTVTNLTGTASININGTVGATTANTGAFTTLTTSSTVTHNGGTANGVAYLNGSKVLTTGSALTFDGANFQVGGNSQPIIRAVSSSTNNATARLFTDGDTAYIGSANTSTSGGSVPVVFQIGGSEQMRLTSTGLGIGTSSPAYKLDARLSGTSSGAVIQVGNTGSGGFGGLGVSDGGAYPVQMWGAALTFLTGSSTYGSATEKMRIDSSGNVGIGTSSPSGKLHVSGDALANTFKLIANTTVSGSDATIFRPADNTMAFSTNGAERMRLDSSGNLGLGVTPSAWGSGTAFQGSGGNLWFRGVTSGISLNQNYAFYSSAGRYVEDGYATRYVQATGTHQWFTAPSGTAGNAVTFTQAMTLTSDGNVGVGTTSPTNLANYKSVTISGTTGGWLEVTNGTVRGVLQNGSGDMTLETRSAHPIILGINGAEKMRLDTSGNLLVGTTSSSARVTIRNATSADGLRLNQEGGTSLYVNNTNASYYAYFVYNGTNTGRIETSGTTTSYVTSSDYRLKENIQPMTGALAKVALLKPCTYKWKADGSDGEGFIAHELQAVVPQCVTGEKDAVDAEGNPRYQGIDTSFLVATLTAALQEAVAEINQLKARLDAANL